AASISAPTSNFASGGGGGADWSRGRSGAVGLATNRRPSSRGGRTPFHVPSATVSAKLLRANSVALLSQSVPVRHPFTLGGENSTCPILASGSRRSPGGTHSPALPSGSAGRTRSGTPARAAPSAYSTGHLTRSEERRGG